MRVEFSRKIRALAFDACNGRCEGCGMKLKAGEGEYDHIIPCAHGGEAILSNCQVLCRTCHKVKTGRNKAETERAKRRADKHSGAFVKQSRPLPGTKASGIKIHFDGTIERRNP